MSRDYTVFKETNNRFYTYTDRAKFYEDLKTGNIIKCEDNECRILNHYAEVFNAYRCSKESIFGVSKSCSASTETEGFRLFNQCDECVMLEVFDIVVDEKRTQDNIREHEKEIAFEHLISDFEKEYNCSVCFDDGYYIVDRKEGE